MRRRQVGQRPGWQGRVEQQGLLFHTVPGASDNGQPAAKQPYWGEGSYYELSTAEVDALEATTFELHQRCLDAVQHIIDHKRYTELGVPAGSIPLIEQTWEEEPPSLYGRMDLTFGADGRPKLLEYNADTPTSLLEAAVIQWTWLEDCFPKLDQFNSLHERLIATWRDLGPHLDGEQVHFGHVASLEDEMTVGYLRDTAEQAGLKTHGILMEDIGWDEHGQRFTDLERQPIRNLFKLYPWEGLLTDTFGPHIARAPKLRWVEPAWKMLLSSKGILPILWQLFPDHPNLLPASFVANDPLLAATGWVEKPLHGREGSNVRIAAPGVSVSTSGPYDSEGFVYQAYVDLGVYEGMRPVLGSWVIGGEPAGLGIRETPGYVTDNTARFVPHVLTR